MPPHKVWIPPPQPSLQIAKRRQGSLNGVLKKAEHPGEQKNIHLLNLNSNFRRDALPRQLPLRGRVHAGEFQISNFTPFIFPYKCPFCQGWFHGHGVYRTVGGGNRFEGEFRGGRIWGHGLLTFNGGKNGSEGYFQVISRKKNINYFFPKLNLLFKFKDTRFSRDCSAKEAVRKARKVASFAR